MLTKWNLIKRSRFLPRKNLLDLYFKIIVPSLTYALPISRYATNKNEFNAMESIHCRASLLRRGSRSTSSPGLFPQKMGGAPHPFFEGKALGTRLVPAGYPNKNRCNTSCPPPPRAFFFSPSLPATQIGPLRKKERHSC